MIGLWFSFNMVGLLLVIIGSILLFTGTRLHEGARLKLHSLPAELEYNGKSGTLIAFDAELKLWQVDLESGGSLNASPSKMTKLEPLSPAYISQMPLIGGGMVVFSVVLEVVLGCCCGVRCYGAAGDGSL